MKTKKLTLRGLDLDLGELANQIEQVADFNLPTRVARMEAQISQLQTDTNRIDHEVAGTNGNPELTLRKRVEKLEQNDAQVQINRKSYEGAVASLVERVAKLEQKTAAITAVPQVAWSAALAEAEEKHLLTIMNKPTKPCWFCRWLGRK